LQASLRLKLRWADNGYIKAGAFKKLKPYMEEFHKTGAKLFIQLTAGLAVHGGSHVMEAIYTNKFLRVLAKPILDVEYMCAAPVLILIAGR
jgi:2-enoate reductase